MTSKDSLTPLAAWVYLVVTVFVEIWISFSGTASALAPATADVAVFAVATSQALVLGLFYLRIKYEGDYITLLLGGSAAIGLMALFLFLWGILGVPLPR